MPKLFFFQPLQVPSGLPRNLEAALQRYGSSTFKAPVATVLDPNGKLSITLTYGKYFVFVLIDILNTFIYIIIYIIIVFFLR